jgi:hypothetical protein
MTTRSKQTKDAEPEIQLLTTAKGASISNRGEVRYSIGVIGDDIYIRLVGSSGGGQINNSWIRYADIQKLLDKYSDGGSFTSSVFDPIFANVSSNNCGFTLAVALKEKLVIPQEGKRRKFVYNSPATFLAKVEKLIAAMASKSATKRKTKATTQSRVSL